MKLFVVSVRDRAADVFGQPSFTLSIGGAIRGFADEINRVAENNVFHKHPDDFDLYELGIYNDADGSFDCHPPRQVAVGKEMVNKG